MSVKKYLGLTAAGLASIVAASTAVAGGPDLMAAPAPDYSGFYVDVDLGYGESDWTNFAGGVMNPTGRAASPGTVSNGQGGFAWGGDIGYQFNQYFGFEVGAYDLEDVDGTVGLGVSNNAAIMAPPAPSSGNVQVQSWVLYVAGKLSVPIFENFDIFGKVGIAFRWLDYSGPGVNGPTAGPLAAVFFINNQHYATWLAGVGLQYWITPEWSVNVQYLHIPGYYKAQEISQQAPKVDLFLGGAGYKFMT